MSAIWGSADRRDRDLASVGVLGLFVAACALPAVRITPWGTDDTGVMRGAAALAGGWMAWPTAVPWLANPLLLAGWLCFWGRRDGAAVGLGWAAVAAGLTVPLAVRPGYVEAVLPGCSLWLASLALFALAATWVRARARALGRGAGATRTPEEADYADAAAPGVPPDPRTGDDGAESAPSSAGR
jgi:hypothetical protein